MKMASTRNPGEMRRLRVLLSCYYFSPYHGGEAAVGWNFATHLARQFDVTVLCGDLGDTLPTLEAWRRYEQSSQTIPGLRVVHVPPSRLTRWIHRAHALPGLWMLYYSAYRLWQKSALSRAQTLHAENPFDLAHQLTIITCREPGYLYRLGIPWFWGPINGAVLMPWKFLPQLGFSGMYRHLTRNILNVLQLRLARRPRRAGRKAAILWTVTREDQEMVSRLWRVNARVMVETGGASVANVPTREARPGEKVRFVWCGIIEARKALRLLLSALAALKSTFDWELHVVGDGPEESVCRRDAAKFGMIERIHWHGRVSHEEAKKILSGGHVLLHSSLKEGTPHVVLEALSLGVPVVCHDACGMGIVVDETCGIKVPLRSPSESILGFRHAVERILADPGIVATLSVGALAKARTLSWEAKAEDIAAAYRSVMG